jgi:pyruvate oxidase
VAKTAAEVLLDVLVENGVEYIFGLPGDSIDPVMDPLRRDRRLRFIQVRHEEAGAFMASAWAKKTGQLGACLGTAGPGAIHLLNGLYDAKMDHAPVIALTGQVATMHVGTDYFQEVDLLALFSDVAVYNQQVTDPEQMAVMAAFACRTALAKRGVAHLALPFDTLQKPVRTPVRQFGARLRRFWSVPAPELLDAAVALVDQAERPVILAGRGALGARGELRALAERLAAPVVHTLPAKGVMPDDHPLVMGGLGLLGAPPAHQAMEGTDLCLMVGTAYPYLEFLPDAAKLVQIDWEESQIGKRHAVDVGLVGTAAPTLQAIAGRVRKRSATPFVDKLRRARAHFLEHMRSDDTGRGTPINPRWVVNRLSQVVEPDANISIDVGNALVWMARGFLAREHGWLVSSWLGSMGFGLPAALASKLAQPDKQSVAVVGDGGFAMLLADFVTAVKYKLPVTVVVLNNHRLAMIKFEQEVAGYPEFGTWLTNPDFAAYAEAAGGRGFRVDDPSRVEDALKHALASNVPAVVDVECDPNERPLPPRITPQQAYGYASALFRETLGL